jgi:hypothetical protein
MRAAEDGTCDVVEKRSRGGGRLCTLEKRVPFRIAKKLCTHAGVFAGHEHVQGRLASLVADHAASGWHPDGLIAYAVTYKASRHDTETGMGRAYAEQGVTFSLQSCKGVIKRALEVCEATLTSLGHTVRVRQFDGVLVDRIGDEDAVREAMTAMETAVKDALGIPLGVADKTNDLTVRPSDDAALAADGPSSGATAKKLEATLRAATAKLRGLVHAIGPKIPMPIELDVSTVDSTPAPRL